MPGLPKPRALLVALRGYWADGTPFIVDDHRIAPTEVLPIRMQFQTGGDGYSLQLRVVTRKARHRPRAKRKAQEPIGSAKEVGDENRNHTINNYNINIRIETNNTVEERASGS